MEYLPPQDEEAARLYLESRGWPDGPICPTCLSSERVSVLAPCRTRKRGYYRCLDCAIDFTIRSGTIMERSKVPLDKWLNAMHLLSGARERVSSVRLAQEIGTTQKSAWFVLSRLREACGDDCGRGRLLQKELNEIASIVLSYRPTPRTSTSHPPTIAAAAATSPRTRTRRSRV